MTLALSGRSGKKGKVIQMFSWHQLEVKKKTGGYSSKYLTFFRLPPTAPAAHCGLLLGEREYRGSQFIVIFFILYELGIKYH